jgi:glycosyltransferase involved in cell wall biosynthesis
VLVVDNHSDDGSRELVASRYPQVRVIDTGRNRGPCHARNVGAAAATSAAVARQRRRAAPGRGRGAAANGPRPRPAAAMVQARSLCGDDPSVVHYDGGDLHFLGTLVLRNWYRPLAEAIARPGRSGPRSRCAS